MKSQGRLYYRVKEGLNLPDLTVVNANYGVCNYYPLPDKALFTQKEYDFLKERATKFNPNWFEPVYVSQKNTYHFFGVRFEI